MYKATDKSLWQGRIDREDAQSLRWHQAISIISLEEKTPEDFQQATTLLGFASDAGVQRNLGRSGAAEGPDSIRNALANVSFLESRKPVDAGNIVCQDNQLEDSQKELGTAICTLLQKNAKLVVLGGGHEIAWGSFQGIQEFLGEKLSNRSLGIINFDAHFDLRHPSPVTSSGTPFRQIADTLKESGSQFHYHVIGLNPHANTQPLFDYAKENGVSWTQDIDCNWHKLGACLQDMENFLKGKSYLYLSVCMDVFSAAHAPGVSAPAALGIEPSWFFEVLKATKKLCVQHQVTLILSDIAETAPSLDRGNRTSKLAARIATELAAC